MNVGLLYPGEMGVSVGAAVMSGGHKVFWPTEGRSSATRQRAERAGLRVLDQLVDVSRQVEVILSVCPPHASESLLAEVIEAGFPGIFVDANAISPQRSLRMSETASFAGMDYVDGTIVGRPAWKAGTTTLYLCGERAAEVAELFSGAPLGTMLLDGPIGKASALKMCFAAYSKGSTALIAAILAAARSLDVYPELRKLWSYDGSEFAEQAEQRSRRVTQKAWRFAGEMEEIADTFSDLGLPDGFHQASEEIYTRLRHFKGSDDLPDLSALLKAILTADE